MPEIIPSRALRPDMPFALAAHEALADHLAAVHVWAAFLPQPDRAHEHHQMRIAAKRLRYALEAFAGVLPPAAMGCMDDLKALQAALGTLHDLDALFVSIEDAMIQGKPMPGSRRNEAARTRRARQRHSLDTLLSAVAAERDAQHRRCLDLWQDLVARDAFAPLRHALATLTAPPRDGAANLTPPVAEDTQL
jgi:CHAD domain-containing protein